MKFTVLIVMCLSQVCQAKTLLVPSQEIAYEKYSEKCTDVNYICTTDYFLKLLKINKTPQFDQLMDSVDLSSEKFIDEFRNKISKILNTENLDRTQLAMLINLMQQINHLQPTLLLKMIQSELMRIQTVITDNIKAGRSTPRKEFIYIFKERLPITAAAKVRTTFLKIPLYIIHFAALPYKTTTFDYKRIIKKPLLAGPCGHSVLRYKIKSAKLCRSKSIDTTETTGPFTKERSY